MNPLGHRPRSGTAGSCDNSTFNFLKNHHTVFHRGPNPILHTEVKALLFKCGQITSLHCVESSDGIPLQSEKSPSPYKDHQAQQGPFTSNLLFSVLHALPPGCTWNTLLPPDVCPLCRGCREPQGLLPFHLKRLLHPHLSPSRPHTLTWFCAWQLCHLLHTRYITEACMMFVVPSLSPHSQSLEHQLHRRPKPFKQHMACRRHSINSC